MSSKVDATRESARNRVARSVRRPSIAIVSAIALIAIFTSVVMSRVEKPPVGAGSISLTTGSSPPSPIPEVPSPAQTSERIPVEVVAIRRTGIEPTEIVRPKGRFMLAVYDRSGLAEVVLRLDGITGQRVHEVRVPKERLDWKNIEDLPPGSYTLTEASHPGWACRITITGG